MPTTRLAQKLSQISGVGLVTISGGQRPAVRIEANSGALNSLGLSLDDVRTALGNANVNQAKGNLDGKYQAYSIGANDQLQSADQYPDVILAYKNGAPIRLAPSRHVGRGRPKTFSRPRGRTARHRSSWQRIPAATER